MPDFDVGNPELQDLLEWVDQPPPQQGRDTHALSFFLAEIPTEHILYGGLLFFRQGNPTSPIFQQQPGLSGIGSQRLTVPGCQRVLGPIEETPDHTYVRVEVRFRPPRVFAALFFLRSGPNGLPGEQVRDVEFNQVNATSFPTLTIQMDPPEGWLVRNLAKTTVLLRP
jgi:hypothetical protein